MEKGFSFIIGVVIMLVIVFLGSYMSHKELDK